MPLIKITFILFSIIFSTSHASDIFITKEKISSYDNFNCNQLDSTLKYHTIRLKQLNSELKEIRFRNAGTGLVSILFFAPAVLALEGSNAEASEIELLSQALTKIRKLSEKRPCKDVKKRIDRFERYLEKVNKTSPVSINPVED